MGIYLNGVLQFNKPFTETYNYSQDLSIGRNVNENYPFKGKLDNIKTYNRALNTAEIDALFKEGCDTYFSPSPIISLAGTNLVVNTYPNAEYQWAYNCRKCNASRL